MAKIALIFGGNGFIGSHLARRLAAQGTYDRIVCADISSEPRFRVPGVDYVFCDVTQSIDPGLVPGVSEIYNLAAVHTTPGHETWEYYWTNVRGATTVCAFARANDVRTIVFTSSISVYGPGEETKSEETKPTPNSAYGWSKLLAEGIHEAWFQEVAGRRLVVVRPAVIFGPAERGNFTRLAKLLAKGWFIYPGRTDTIKACFYVDDLIDAFGFALAQPDAFVRFNGCYSDRYTISQIVDTMRKVQFTGAKTVVFPKLPLVLTAKALQPLSASGLGIHPDRILKLIRSTDIVPGWLKAQAFPTSGRLESAIERWKSATEGRFD